MRLTVHIGTTKTGSKSIQDFLHLNRDRLGLDGVFVPATLGRPYHLKAVLAAAPFGSSKELARSIPITDESSYWAFRERTVDDFHAEVERNDNCKEGVITAELLHSRLPLQEHVEEFKSLFCESFEGVRIVVYVRPQLDHVVSLYSTMLRNRYAGSVDDFVRSHLEMPVNRYFDLQDVIGRWTRVFGEQSIIVRPYKGLQGGDGSLGDFLRILGVDASDERWERGGDRNVSINPDGQELLRIINTGAGVEGGRLKRVTRWVERNHPGPGAFPSRELATAFHEKFVESNRWVVDRYFPGHPEYLEPRWR